VIIGNCRFSDDVLYDTDSNTWVRFEEDGTATVGISTVLAYLGGPLHSITFKPVGTVVERGKALGSIEGPRHFDTVRSPITGKVVEMNPALAGNPRLLNREPYGGGWFARLEPLNREQEMPMVKTPSMARAELQTRISELKIRCFAEFPDSEMYEIGTECSAVLVRLDELLAGSPIGTVVHLVSDDPASEVEMIRWSDRTGNQLLETRREGKLVHYVLKKTQP
jgi:glycine cleavage system H protein